MNTDCEREPRIISWSAVATYSRTYSIYANLVCKLTYAALNFTQLPASMLQDEETTSSHVSHTQSMKLFRTI